MSEKEILDEARARLSAIKSWVACVERDINKGERHEAAGCVESLEKETDRLHNLCLEMNDDEYERQC